jgi:purine-binding chemotaxis protein CheW
MHRAGGQGLFPERVSIGLTIQDTQGGTQDMQTEMVERQENPMAGIPAKEGKYLTFSLAGEEYGIGILKVKEIIGMMNITPVPQTPAFVKGVINLRGKVIPVVDLRLRFALEAAAYTERTCIIVVEVAGANGSIMMGIVVDAVSEVLNIRGADIENTPAFGVRLDTDFILGMAKAAGGIKILLDIDKVLSSEDLVAVRHMA